jgi:hypothetical protein
VPRQLARERQPEPGAGCALAPGAAAVEALEDVLLLARVEPRPAVAHLQAAGEREHLDVAARGRVRERVLHQRVEDPVGVLAADPGRPAAVRARAQALVSLGRGRRPALRGARRELWQRMPLAGGGALAGAAELEQLVDHQREPVELRQRRVELLVDRRVAALALRGLDAQPQAGQRGPQLVRSVGDEVALRAHEPLEPRGHVVEGAGQRALLGAALDGRTGRQIALGDAAGGTVQSPHRPRDLPRHDGAGEQPEPEHEQADQREPDPGAALGAVDGLDALRHARGADRAASRHDRDGRHQQRLPERLGAPLAPVGPPGQRGLDLRAAGVRAPGWRALGVGEQVAVGVDHDDAPAHALGGGVDQPLALARVAGAEQVGDGRGNDVGLGARLRAHLGVDPVGDARGQRHLERDDGQHEHVRKRQQQPGTESYGTAPSALLKRKPTPRTVWM